MASGAGHHRPIGTGCQTVPWRAAAGAGPLPGSPCHGSLPGFPVPCSVRRVRAPWAVGDAVALVLHGLRRPSDCGGRMPTTMLTVMHRASRAALPAPAPSPSPCMPRPTRPRSPVRHPHRPRVARGRRHRGTRRQSSRWPGRRRRAMPRPHSRTLWPSPRMPVTASFRRPHSRPLRPSPRMPAIASLGRPHSGTHRPSPWAPRMASPERPHPQPHRPPHRRPMRRAARPVPACCRSRSSAAAWRWWCWRRWPACTRCMSPRPS